MAKIDTTKIEGYENMSPEEKVAAFEAFEYNDNAHEVERYKNAVTKANSEAAEWKKKHNALLSEDEQSKAAAEEELNTLRNKVAELEKSEKISSYKAKFLALGYDDELANDTAVALADGDISKVFSNQKQHLDLAKKKLRSDILKDTPKPDGGNSESTITKEKFRAMSVQERHDFYVNHPEEYKNLYGGNT